MPTSDLVKDTEDARAAARELHEAIKDARKLYKELSAATDELLGAFRREFDQETRTIIKSGLDDYQEELGRHIDEATKAVYKRFDKIAEMLLAGPRRGTTKELNLEQVAILNAAITILEQ